MDRSALLKIIHKDLNELQMLLDGMQGYDEIPEPIINLARVKVTQLSEYVHDLPGDVMVIAENKVVMPDVAVVPPVQAVKENKVREEETTESDLLIESEVEEEHEIPKEDVVLEADSGVLEPTPELDVQQAVIENVEEPVLVEKTIEQQTEMKPVVSTPKTKVVLGETIGRGEKVIDTIKKDISGSLSARLEGAPVSDLKKAININDRFMFQKELFGNDANSFNDCVERLNGMASFNDAVNYMAENCDWNFEDEITARFVALVNRRFK